MLKNLIDLIIASTPDYLNEQNEILKPFTRLNNLNQILQKHNKILKELNS